MKQVTKEVNNAILVYFSLLHAPLKYYKCNVQKYEYFLFHKYLYIVQFTELYNTISLSWY